MNPEIQADSGEVYYDLQDYEDPPDLPIVDPIDYPQASPKKIPAITVTSPAITVSSPAITVSSQKSMTKNVIPKLNISKLESEETIDVWDIPDNPEYQTEEPLPDDPQADKFVLNNKWVMYFHKTLRHFDQRRGSNQARDKYAIADSDLKDLLKNTGIDEWDPITYIKVYEITNGLDISILRILVNFNNCNYSVYMMKENIKPTWEDPNNQNGETCSINVGTSNFVDSWIYMCWAITGESLFTNYEFMKYVNGISMDIKKGDVFIKLWLSECDKFIANYFDISVAKKIFGPSFDVRKAKYKRNCISIAMDSYNKKY